jgi:signal transduction histidine kinase
MIEEGKEVGFLKLIQNRTREHALLKSKDEFITVAAHQLRTPLTAIGWGLETIARTMPQNQEMEQVMKEERSLVERSLKIINDLLDAAKIEEGQFGYVFQEINLNELLEQIVAQAIEIAKAYHVTITYNHSTEIERVQGDAKKIAIVLINIVDNAIKYNTKGGSVTITIEKLANKDFVKIIVEDTGIGVPKEDVNKLFGKFYRGPNAVPVEPNGSGLGLYIVKNIIKRHGGEIGFESIINRGSTVWFTIPTNASLIPPQEL